MPVYLCAPGTDHLDPWRHGIHVYCQPCRIDQEEDNNNDNNTEQRDWVTAVLDDSAATTVAQSVRRVRHAELILVDDVCMAHGRYWVRLRWPGRRGGFAGYIAMGTTIGSSTSTVEFLTSSPDEPSLSSPSNITAGDETEDDPTGEETGSMPPSEPGDHPPLLTCARTSITFPSTGGMNLLAAYDDGLAPPVSLPPLPTESVICRICREGLHDDADEELPAAEGEETVSKAEQSRTSQSAPDADRNYESNVIPSIESTRGPVHPRPVYSVNRDAVQNPMLAPCECSGSMAFVHYLCIEQWRCRSRHPAANAGRNCETCGAEYALPPPTGRDVDLNTEDPDEFPDAMPHHVMQALRQPHIWWQIGAGIIRRRWLRPLAPVFMSPVVALYCRARRLLKKRGVARRRWACSLCRRRARWKCVRCLRSYYCSRHCQNVSWHIIHKHVCYKPVRFWWSVILYGVLALLLFPGSMRDPVMYDLGLSAIPFSFVIAGILGGTAASITKRATGIDARGRMLEFAVVLSTAALSVLTWGLIRAFFGDSAGCYGALGSTSITEEDLQSTTSLVGLFHWLALRPAKSFYLYFDRLCERIPPYVGRFICMGEGHIGCFEHMPYVNDRFFVEEEGGERCAADLIFMCSLYSVAFMCYVVSTVARRRHRRNRVQRPQLDNPRWLQNLPRARV